MNRLQGDNEMTFSIGFERKLRQDKKSKMIVCIIPKDIVTALELSGNTAITIIPGEDEEGKYIMFRIRGDIEQKIKKPSSDPEKRPPQEKPISSAPTLPVTTSEENTPPEDNTIQESDETQELKSDPNWSPNMAPGIGSSMKSIESEPSISSPGKGGR
jgi:hypothetical protein